jgi:tetratricopeptide (TPR) repeat protein
MKVKYIIFLLLPVLCSCTSEADRTRMRAGLDSINVRNRNDQSFTVSDVQPYVDFFDKHGSSNDRLLAHYLLGRAYHEQGEAPMALQCYQQAAECADTTAEDCNYAQLSRVYGQSAKIFYQQGLYRNQIEYCDLSSEYGWRGNDSLNALLSYANKASAYDQLQMKDSAILIYTDAIKQLRVYKFNKVAAGFAGILAKKLIDNGKMAEAEPYMHDYEQHSGYFDSLGNIVKGREFYYNAKGLYYLKSNLLDSADYYFRKELRTGKDFGNQNSGSHRLAQLFMQKHMNDSAAKYALYAYEMNDSVYVQRSTREIEQAKAMYDYSRQQEIAQQEREKANQKQRIIWYLVISSVLIIIYVLYRLYKKQEEQKRLIEKHISLQTEVMQLRLHKENYDKLLQEKDLLGKQLGTTQSEIEELRTAKSKLDLLIAQKENELEQQKIKISVFKKAKAHQHETEKQLKDSSVFKLLTDKANRGLELSETEWKQIERMVIDCLPEFYRFVSSREYALTIRMYRICILTRLQFPNKAIGCMMGVSAPSISKTRPIIYKKLFGENDNGKDLGEKLLMFC